MDATGRVVAVMPASAKIAEAIIALERAGIKEDKLGLIIMQPIQMEEQQIEGLDMNPAFTGALQAIGKAEQADVPGLGQVAVAGLARDAIEQAKNDPESFLSVAIGHKLGSDETQKYIDELRKAHALLVIAADSNKVRDILSHHDVIAVMG